RGVKRGAPQSQSQSDSAQVEVEEEEVVLKKSKRTKATTTTTTTKALPGPANGSNTNTNIKPDWLLQYQLRLFKGMELLCLTYQLLFFNFLKMDHAYSVFR
ncbi:hypothetical protein FRX31_017892, partial [Thalictrum thalictroides]